MSNSNRMIVVLPLVILLVAITAVVVLGGGHNGPNPDKETLENSVSQVIRKGDSVVSRKVVDDIFKLGDIYAGEQDLEKAKYYFEEGLKVDSARYEYQIKLANILIAKKETERASEIAKTVYMYAEDDVITKKAEILLETYSPTIISSIRSIENKQCKSNANNKITLSIVPIGSIDPRVIREIKCGLEKYTGINYIVAPNRIEQGDINRSYVVPYVKNIFRNVNEYVPEDIKKKIALEAKLPYTYADTHEGRLLFLEILLEKGNQEEYRQFKKALVELSEKRQYNADRYVSEIEKEYPSRKTIKGYLGITAEDIYSDDANFVFGVARKDYGVVSYARFKSMFNDEKQNRQKFIERSTKQAISSVLFILDIPRCTTPNCVHAYPNSLNEHDKKNMEMCSICNKRLATYIKNNK